MRVYSKRLRNAGNRLLYAHWYFDTEIDVRYDEMVSLQRVLDALRVEVLALRVLYFPVRADVFLDGIFWYTAFSFLFAGAPDLVGGSGFLNSCVVVVRARDLVDLVALVALVDGSAEL